MNDKIKGVIRAVVAAGVGYLAGKGLIDGASVDQIVTVATALVISIWSWLSK